MSDYQRPIRPIITGSPGTLPQQKPVSRPADSTGFSDILRSRLEDKTPKDESVTLSRHAQARAEQRGISLSETDMQKLGTAVNKASGKGINDTLVLMNSTAFIVNVPSRVVVTMVDSNDDATIISNIDGAVIL